MLPSREEFFLDGHTEGEFEDPKICTCEGHNSPNDPCSTCHAEEQREEDEEEEEEELHEPAHGPHTGAWEAGDDIDDEV